MSGALQGSLAALRTSAFRLSSTTHKKVKRTSNYSTRKLTISQAVHWEEEQRMADALKQMGRSQFCFLV
jgi:hypothetical protein